MTDNLDTKYASLVSQLEALLATLNQFINGGPDETVVTDKQVLNTISGIQESLKQVRFMQRVKDHRLLDDALSDSDIEEGMLVRVWGDSVDNNGIYKLSTDDSFLKISDSEIPTSIESIQGLTTSLSSKVDKVAGKGLSDSNFTVAEKSKLTAVAPGATANQPDSVLLSRSNHTGTQDVSTITGLETALTSFATKEYVDDRTGGTATDFIPIKIEGTGAVGSTITAIFATGWTSGGGIWTRNGVEIQGATTPSYTILMDGIYTWKDSRIPFTPTSVFVVESTPGKVINLVLSNTTQNSLGYTFDPPLSGSVVTDYFIQYKKSSSSTWITYNDGETPDTFGVISGLELETSYDVRVQAKNSLGYGPYSDTATRSTSSAIPSGTLYYDGFPLLLDGMPLVLDDGSVVVPDIPITTLFFDSLPLQVDGIYLESTQPSNTGLYYDLNPLQYDSLSLSYA